MLRVKTGLTIGPFGWALALPMPANPTQHTVLGHDRLVGLADNDDRYSSLATACSGGVLALPG